MYVTNCNDINVYCRTYGCNRYYPVINMFMRLSKRPSSMVIRNRNQIHSFFIAVIRYLYSAKTLHNTQISILFKIGSMPNRRHASEFLHGLRTWYVFMSYVKLIWSSLWQTNKKLINILSVCHNQNLFSKVRSLPTIFHSSVM